MESEAYIEDVSDEAEYCGPSVVERVVVHRTVDRNKTRSLVSERIAVNDRGKEDFVEREIAIPFEEKSEVDYIHDRSIAAIRSRKEGDAFDLYLSMKGKNSYEYTNTQRLEMQQQGLAEQKELTRTIKDLTSTEGTDEELELAMLADEVEDSDIDQDFHQLANAIEASVAAGQPVSDAELSLMCERVINQTPKPPTENEACHARLLENEQLERTRTMNSDEIQEKLELFEAKRYARTLEQLGDSKLQLEEKYIKDIEAVQEQIPQPREQEKYLQLLAEKFDTKLDQIENVRATLRKPRILYQSRYSDQTDAACPTSNDNIVAEACRQAPVCPTQGPPKPIQTCPKPVQACPRPVQTCPKPVQTCPRPVQSCPKPVQNCAKPIQACPQPIRTCPRPVQAVQACPKPMQTCPRPVQTCPKPVQNYAKPMQACPRPVKTCPRKVQAVQSCPRPAPPTGGQQCIRQMPSSAPAVCRPQNNVCPQPNTYQQFDPRTVSTPQVKNQCARPRLASGSDAPDRRDLPGPSWWDPAQSPRLAQAPVEYRDQPELLGCDPEEIGDWQEYNPQNWECAEDQAGQQQGGQGYFRPDLLECDSDEFQEQEDWQEYNPELWEQMPCEPQQQQQQAVPVRKDTTKTRTQQAAPVCPTPSANVCRPQTLPATTLPAATDRREECPRPTLNQSGRRQAVDSGSLAPILKPSKSEAIIAEINEMIKDAIDIYERALPESNEIKDKEELEIHKQYLQCELQTRLDHIHEILDNRQEAREIYLREFMDAKAKIKDKDLLEERMKFIGEEYDNTLNHLYQTAKRRSFDKPVPPTKKLRFSRNIDDRNAPAVPHPKTRSASSSINRSQKKSAFPSVDHPQKKSAAELKKIREEYSEISRKNLPPRPEPQPPPPPPQISESRIARAQADRRRRALAPAAASPKKSAQEIAEERKQLKLKYGLQSLPASALPRARTLPAVLPKSETQIKAERKKHLSKTYTMKPEDVPSGPVYRHAKPVQLRPPSTSKPVKEIAKQREELRSKYNIKALPPASQPKASTRRTPAKPQKSASQVKGEQLQELRKQYTVKPGDVPKGPVYKHAKPVSIRPPVPVSTREDVARKREVLKEKYSMKALPPAALPRPRAAPRVPERSAAQIKAERLQELRQQYTVKPGDIPRGPEYRHSRPVNIRPPPPARSREDIARQREQLRERYNINALPPTARPRPMPARPRPERSAAQIKAERLQELRQQYTVKPGDIPRGPEYRHSRPVNIRPPRPARTREDIAREREQLRERYNINALPPTARPRPMPARPRRERSAAQVRAEQQRNVRQAYNLRPGDVPRGPNYRPSRTVCLRPEVVPKPSAKDLKKIKLRYSIKGGGSLGEILAARRPEERRQKPRKKFYTIPTKSKLQLNARRNHIHEVNDAKALIKNQEELKMELKFLSEKFQEELAFIDRFHILPDKRKGEFLDEYESSQRPDLSPRTKRELLQQLSQKLAAIIQASKRVGRRVARAHPGFPDDSDDSDDSDESDDEIGRRTGAKPKRWQPEEKDLRKLKKKIEEDIEDIRKSSNNNNKALLKQIMNVPDKPAMAVGDVKRMVKGVKGITAKDLKEALGKAKEETYKNKKKMERLPPRVIKSMGKRGDERFAKSAIEKEQTDEVYRAMMLEKKGVKFKDDPNNVAPLIAPSNAPKLQVVGNAIESVSVGILPNQIPTTAINQLDAVATEEVATTLASKSKAPPPNNIARSKLCDKTTKVKIPSGTNKNEYLECDVRLENLAIETLFQGKGSVLPDWFPGFFTVLPGAQSAVLPQSSPSNVLFEAWEKMQPEYTRTEI